MALTYRRGLQIFSQQGFVEIFPYQQPLCHISQNAPLAARQSLKVWFCRSYFCGQEKVLRKALPRAFSSGVFSPCFPVEAEKTKINCGETQLLQLVKSNIPRSTLILWGESFTSSRLAKRISMQPDYPHTQLNQRIQQHLYAFPAF